ncbi:NAD-dependent deacylase [Deferrisoma camini]|uniref:NAD-dependent deacylase n=1 Tax=Deferrisoma camini TaxID=1035120 RepID=UPI0004B40592|nr:NAD-dependent deacylase [Deferrisoma camini]
MSGRDPVAELTGLLRKARRPVALTGAGVSAESGVPTFRGPDGLWRRHRPEDLATPEAFARDPALVWEWYNWRRERIAPARPNPAHRWLAAYERANPGFLLITQNVDGLHRLAGSRRLVEVHGNLWVLRCTRCGREGEDRRVPLPVPPRCPECGGLLRPGVVWFGEPLPAEALTRSTEAVQEADLLLVIGTSAVVQPVASFPLLARGAVVVEINPAATPLTPSLDLSVRSAAGALFRRIPLPGPPPAGSGSPSPSHPGGTP